MKFVDTHCHIDTYEEMAKESFEDLLKRMEHSPEFFVHNACAPADFEYGKRLSEKSEKVFVAYGVHPEYFREFKNAKLDLRSYWNTPKCVACGEFGLDYHYGKEFRDEQILVFEEQLELALLARKTLVLHLREAEEDALAILKNANLGRAKIHLHCFTSHKNFAEQMLSLSENLYIGFTGIITFKNAESIREALKIVPENRLLLETDSPYLAPVPHRGTPSHSGMIPFIAEKMAEVKGIPLEELYEQIRENTRDVYGI